MIEPREPVGERRFSTVQSRAALDYVLRTVQQSQIHLSAMADAKANILITVCSIVLTLGITQLGSPLLRWPLVVLTATTLVSLLLAILAVLPTDRFPRTPSGDVDTGASWFNLLYFGHFSRLSRTHFEELLEQLMHDDTLLYTMLARDIYGQGLVLGQKKYRLLRWSYMVFLVGVFATSVAAVATVFRAP
jgi:hypothetical protein